MLLCESIYLGKMIERLPKSSIIDRMSLESRKHKVDAEIIDMQVAKLKEIDSPPSYVKPTRYEVKLFNTDVYKVIEVATGVSWATVPVRDNDYERVNQAAERIAAIYEEVMP